jgi:hypothetical protein
MFDLLPKIAPFIVGAIVIALLVQGARSLWFRSESRRWPSVRGKVLVARITPGYELDEDDRRVEYFEVEVQYEYRVNGKPYIGTRHSFGSERFSTYDDAIDALHGISAGREVAVYYDPSLPERAVLRKG